MLLLTLAGCERGATSEQGSQRAADPTPGPAASLDLGALRASAVDGLEAAARDPAIAARLALAQRLETPEVSAALERLLARATADEQLRRAADEFFVALQDSPGMRAALVDYARDNPGLELSALSEGFVGYVESRLTRPELAEQLEQQLRAELRGADVALARAWVSEAGGATALAAGVLARVEDPSFSSTLAERLGRDARAVQARLERRLADPSRAGSLLVAFAPTLDADEGAAALVEILDAPRSAELLAAALARALADEQLRERCEGLFALALAPDFDSAGFARALESLFAEQVVMREAAALLSALAREPAVREAVARLSSQFTRAPAFDAQLLQVLG